MAVIDTGYLSTIAEENQRLIATAKGLSSLNLMIQYPRASSMLQEQINRLLDISEGNGTLFAVPQCPRKI